MAGSLPDQSAGDGTAADRWPPPALRVEEPQESHFDFPGAALSLIALFSIVLAVKRFAEYGNELLAWGTLVGGVVVLIGFIARQRSAELAKRISPRIIIMTGFLIAAAGFVFIGATAVPDSPWWFVGGYVATDLRGRGNGQCFGQYLDHLHRPGRSHRVGCQCLRYGCPARRSPGHCGVLATLHHLLRQEMTETAPDVSAPGDSLAEAKSAANQLPTDQATALLDAASSAFASSMSTVAFTIAGLSLAAGVLTGVLLRRVPVTDQETQESDETSSTS